MEQPRNRIVAEVNNRGEVIRYLAGGSDTQPITAGVRWTTDAAEASRLTLDAAREHASAHNSGWRLTGRLRRCEVRHVAELAESVKN